MGRKGRKMEAPLVSVVIPVYNVENYLRQCLDSVRNQTYSNIEIICIDDQSTDGSPDILKEYSSQDNRIVLLQNEENRGVAYSRNVGIERACGEYLLFVDSDDYIRQELIETVLEKAKGSDMVSFDYIEVMEQKDCETLHRYNLEDGIYRGAEAFVQAVLNQSVIYAPWSRLYDRKFLEENRIRFYNGILYEDVLFYFLCMLAAKRVVVMRERMYVYRIRHGSIMKGQITCKSLESYFISICELTRYYFNKRFDACTSQAIELYIQGVCREFVKACRKCEEWRPQAGDPIEGIEKYLKLYGIFAGFCERRGGVDGLDEKELQRIRAAEKIVVYGAGDIARDVLEILDRYDVPIEGLAVTRAGDNRKSIMGCRVKEIVEYKEDRDICLVVIATSPQYYPEIRSELKRQGFMNYMEII